MKLLLIALLFSALLAAQITPPPPSVTSPLATPVSTTNGGTGSALTPDLGAIAYSSASAIALLAHNATANMPLLSGASAAPTWATVSHPASAVSGGLAYFSSSTVMASSGLLTANALVYGGGAGGAPATLASLGVATTVLHGNAGGPPAWGAVALATDVSGILPPANGGFGAALTPDLGAIAYSSASAIALLAHNATANMPLLSGASAAPTWATVSHPTSAVSGGLAYFSSSTAMASSGLLTTNAILVGGGAGGSPFTLASLGVTTTVLHGNAGGPPAWGSVALGTDVSGILPLANGGLGIATATGTTGTGNVVLSNAPALTGVTTAVALTLSGTSASGGASGAVPCFLCAAGSISPSGGAIGFSLTPTLAGTTGLGFYGLYIRMITGAGANSGGTALAAMYIDTPVNTGSQTWTNRYSIYSPDTDPSVFAGTVQSAGYKSSDGTAGVTVTTCTGYKNGLCISGS